MSENTKYMYDVREVLGPCLGTMQIFVKILYFQSSKKKKKEWCINDTGILGKKSNCSYQELNLRPSDY